MFFAFISWSISLSTCRNRFGWSEESDRFIFATPNSSKLNRRRRRRRSEVGKSVGDIEQMGCGWNVFVSSFVWSTPSGCRTKLGGMFFSPRMARIPCRSHHLFCREALRNAIALQSSATLRANAGEYFSITKTTLKVHDEDDRSHWNRTTIRELFHKLGISGGFAITGILGDIKVIKSLATDFQLKLQTCRGRRERHHRKCKLSKGSFSNPNSTHQSPKNVHQPMT